MEGYPHGPRAAGARKVHGFVQAHVGAAVSPSVPCSFFPRTAFPSSNRATGPPPLVSYSEVIKHSASVQVTNAVPLLARRLWNVLLARSYDELPDWDIRKHAVPVTELLDALDVTTRNTEHLKDLLTALTTTAIQWNVLGKDQVEEWGVSALLAEAKIRDGIVEFSYGPTLRERLHNPRVYVRISLSIQNRFSSKHALALYELCVDYLDATRGRGETPWIEVDTFREMMGLDADQYARFAQLNQRVVKASVSEINKKSDIRVGVDYRKDGRRVEAIKFHVRPSSRTAAPLRPPTPTLAAARFAGPPSAHVPSPTDKDAFDLWLEAQPEPERLRLRALAVARLPEDQRVALEHAEAEGRYVPSLELGVVVRLRAIWQESQAERAA